MYSTFVVYTEYYLFTSEWNFVHPIYLSIATNTLKSSSTDAGAAAVIAAVVASGHRRESIGAISAAGS